MSNPRVPYRFSDAGPALKAHVNGPILVHLVVNVENWSFDAAMPRTIITPPHGKETIPDVPNFAWVDYGMRAGLPRMIQAIRERGLPASTSINASVLDAYPGAAEAMLQAGWEFIGHGLHQKSVQQAGNEEDVVTQALDKLRRFSGQAVAGWLSPGLRETERSLEVFKSAGVRYVFDWCMDDLPNWMRTDQGPILSMPYNLELNDSVVYAIEKHATGQFLERTQRTLRLFEREAQQRPRVLALGLHPHLMGVPHRFGEFEEMLDSLLASSMTAFVKPEQIADWFEAQVAPA
ncbi:polysaccharide deacetylase family protein [Orrella daihaiensis]|uniref:Polysaccharide deacetylase family protein n=1 Tax=Orrella daihaiensis TaxID=2782176 RepID=A0ABY4ALC4_9BURK|nr:polysaccharide deacetylase family protein [Orrella daihaiensis]UOD51088.1 polysaccharide deacetylase family protein [Orrella daihaiensis]